jgi:hypothetical protein
MKKKRAYYVGEKDSEYGIAVIASNAKEAKKLAFGVEPLDDVEWIDLRVRWNKRAIIDDLPVGFVFNDDRVLEGVHRHVYAFADYFTCPNCGAEDVRVEEIYDDVFGCEQCEDDLKPEMKNNPYRKQSYESS